MRALRAFRLSHIPIAAVLLASTGLFAARDVRADGQCKGERQHSMAEMEFRDRAVAALESLFLTQPSGWMLELNRDGKDGNGAREWRRKGPDNYCVENQNDPIYLVASARAIRVLSLEEARAGRADIERLEGEVAAARKLPPDQQAKVDELMAESTAARHAARRAEIDKNRELAKSKYDEENAKLREARLIREAHEKSVREQVSKLHKQQAEIRHQIEPKRYTINLSANAAVWATKSPDNIEFGNGGAKVNKTTTKVMRTAVSLVCNDCKGEMTEAERATLKSMVDMGRLKALASGTLPSIDDSIALAEKNGALIREASEKPRADMKLAVEETKAERESKDKARLATEKQARQAKSEKDGKTDAKSADAKSAGQTVSVDKPTEKPAEKQTDPAQQAKDAVNKLRGLFGK